MHIYKCLNFFWWLLLSFATYLTIKMIFPYYICLNVMFIRFVSYIVSAFSPLEFHAFLFLCISIFIKRSIPWIDLKIISGDTLHIIPSFCVIVSSKYKVQFFSTFHCTNKIKCDMHIQNCNRRKPDRWFAYVIWSKIRC